jgi:PAS domain S-box-containing protein
MTAYSFQLNGQRVSQIVVHDITEQLVIQSELRASEEHLRAVASVVTDAIWDRDLRTDTVQWGGGLSSMFGYSGKEVESHTWWLSHVHPDEQIAVEGSIEAALASGATHWSSEYRFLRPNRAYTLVADKGHIMRDSAGRPYRFIGAMVDLEEQLREVEIAAQARRDERLRLAQDLHGSATQSLYSINLIAEAARRHLTHGDQAKMTEALIRLGELSRQALRQLRLLLYEMRPDQLEQLGLVAAIRHRLEAVEQRAGLRIDLSDRTEGHSPQPARRVLFSETLKVLNRYLTQSGATSVTVELTGNSEAMTVVIRHECPPTSESMPNDEPGGTATLHESKLTVGTSGLASHEVTYPTRARGPASRHSFISGRDPREGSVQTTR